MFFQQSSFTHLKVLAKTPHPRGETISETSIIWCPVLSFGLLRLVDDDLFFWGGDDTLPETNMLLMEEIPNNHLTCMKPCKLMGYLPY